MQGLRAVFVALVDNACRYAGSDGAVTIGARVRLEQDALVLEFVDDGPGITTKERELIFESGFRGRDARATTSAGLGMGLFFAQGVMTRMGGRIRLAGGRRGAAFEISLPLEHVDLLR